MNRLLSVLFWSVISAAFIGPGTVTTAASSGAGFGYTLLWALTFSTVACLLLQEASARITVISGHSLGQALRHRYRGGLSGVVLLLLVLGAIVLGCAAYEAGNILGGVAGAVLGTGLPRVWLTLVSGFGAAVVLWFGAPRTVARLLSLLVAIMGVAFLLTAWRLAPPWPQVVEACLLPRLPAESGLLVLGLVGTTVVPYNLFLGSGLARGQRLEDLRFGLSVAVLLGGVISMGVLVVGAAAPLPFSFEGLVQVLVERLGGWAKGLFASGLFAAGLSSAITAPLAAAVTARDLFATGEDDPGWDARSLRFRGVWGGVLAVGLSFGLAGVRPVPAIVLAQALNGVLLPLVAVFLLLVVNDRRLMGEKGLNGWFSNALLGLVVMVALVLGVANVAKAAAVTLGYPPPGEEDLVALSSLVALVVAVPVALAVRRRRADRR